MARDFPAVRSGLEQKMPEMEFFVDLSTLLVGNSIHIVTPM